MTLGRGCANPASALDQQALGGQPEHAANVRAMTLAMNGTLERWIREQPVLALASSAWAKGNVGGIICCIHRSRPRH
jgi:hypothetical protein